jgi:hypothetical protein
VNDTAVHTFYSGRTTNWFALWLTTVLAVPLLALGVANGSWTGLGLIAAAVIVVAVLVNLLTANSVRSIAGPNGVTVHFGVFGWPRFRYPLDRIRDAEAVEISVSPWRWGWGISWSPRQGLWLTLRTGPALRLTLTNGRRVTISTPLPENAVRAIADARGEAAQR